MSSGAREPGFFFQGRENKTSFSQWGSSFRARDLWKQSLQLKARDYATCLSIVSAATSGEAAGFMQMGRALSSPGYGDYSHSLRKRGQGLETHFPRPSGGRPKLFLLFIVCVCVCVSLFLCMCVCVVKGASGAALLHLRTGPRDAAVFEEWLPMSQTSLGALISGLEQ